MGTYDTFIDQSGTRYQSKAFGKGMRIYRVGDPATIRRAPTTQDEHEEWLDTDTNEHPGPRIADCQVLHGSGDARSTYLILRSGTFVGVTPFRDDALPLFNNLGQDITRWERNMRDPSWARRFEQIRVLAWSHRACIQGAYSEPSLAVRFNIAVASLLAHASAVEVSVDAIEEPSAWARFQAEVRAEQRRRETKEASRREAAGFGNFDLRNATAAERTRYLAWCESEASRDVELLLDRGHAEQQRRALRQRLGDIPRSPYVIGTTIPPVPEEPMPLDSIAEVLLQALEVTVRKPPVVVALPVGHRRGTGRDTARDLYLLHAAAYEEVGLRIPNGSPTRRD